MANSQTVMLVIRSSRPTFRNNRDKVAFVVHASFVASGFRLVANGRPAFAENALASSPTQGEVGIEGWNEFDEYAFVYVNPKKGSKKVLVKCLGTSTRLSMLPKRRKFEQFQAQNMKNDVVDTLFSFRKHNKSFHNLF